MVMIALLDLPPELPPDASARQFGFDTFASGLPEYLSRCKNGHVARLAKSTNNGSQVRLLKVDFLQVREPKRMGHTHFVLWHVYASLAVPKKWSTSP
jgi:hypothetical protein